MKLTGIIIIIIINVNDSLLILLAVTCDQQRARCRTAPSDL